MQPVVDVVRLFGNTPAEAAQYHLLVPPRRRTFVATCTGGTRTTIHYRAKCRLARRLDASTSSCIPGSRPSLRLDYAAVGFAGSKVATECHAAGFKLNWINHNSLEFVLHTVPSLANIRTLHLSSAYILSLNEDPQHLLVDQLDQCLQLTTQLIQLVLFVGYIWDHHGIVR